MRWEHFLSKVKHLPYIREEMLCSSQREKLNFRNQLVMWHKRGRLWRLRQGLYILPPTESRNPLSANVAANIIYQPSYLSLEYALSYYGLIPEAVYQLTSVTSLKTKSFHNPFGDYIYRHVKPALFFGFIQQVDEHNHPYLIATAEKALLDKVYFEEMATISKNYFLESLRLQNFTQLKWHRLLEYSQAYDGKKMRSVIQALKVLLRR